MAVVAAGVTLAATGGCALAQAQYEEGPQSSVELIDPRVFRVCADPSNLPFSNDKQEGFENKLAELIAKKLNKAIAYVWYPGSVGFVRNTLGAHRCDVIMGMPQGGDIAQVTNPYYRTSYALVYKEGNGLDGVNSLTDPRLKDKRLGVVAGTPPASVMAAHGLIAHAKPYPLVIDTRVDSSAQAMVKDVRSGEIDVGVLWGPMAGYYATKSEPKLTVAPLAGSPESRRLVYRIGMAVRPADQEFKRLLNRVIRDSQTEINALLLNYGIPLLDSKDRPITAANQATQD